MDKLTETELVKAAPLGAIAGCEAQAAFPEGVGQFGARHTVRKVQVDLAVAHQEHIGPRSVRIEIADVGAPPPNLAVAAVRLAGDRLIASVRSTDSRPRDTRVRVAVDGRPSGEMPVSMQASC